MRFVTPEGAPLAVFGTTASAAIGELFRARRISIETSRTGVQDVPAACTCPPTVWRWATRSWSRYRRSKARGSRGLPYDPDGFIPIDEYARVEGIEGVYAAGDGTNFPVKQGGLATQQADAAAEHIAAGLGADVEPEPFKPVSPRPADHRRRIAEPAPRSHRRPGRRHRLDGLPVVAAGEGGRSVPSGGWDIRAPVTSSRPRVPWRSRSPGRMSGTVRRCLTTPRSERAEPAPNPLSGWRGRSALDQIVFDRVGDQLCAGVEAGLALDVRPMGLDCTDAENQLVGDLRVHVAEG